MILLRLIRVMSDHHKLSCLLDIALLNSFELLKFLQEVYGLCNRCALTAISPTQFHVLGKYATRHILLLLIIAPDALIHPEAVQLKSQRIAYFPGVEDTQSALSLHFYDESQKYCDQDACKGKGHSRHNCQLIVCQTVGRKDQQNAGLKHLEDDGSIVDILHKDHCLQHPLVDDVERNERKTQMDQGSHGATLLVKDEGSRHGKLHRHVPVLELSVELAPGEVRV